MSRWISESLGSRYIAPHSHWMVVTFALYGNQGQLSPTVQCVLSLPAGVQGGGAWDDKDIISPSNSVETLLWPLISNPGNQDVHFGRAWIYSMSKHIFYKWVIMNMIKEAQTLSISWFLYLCILAIMSTIGLAHKQRFGGQCFILTG